MQENPVKQAGQEIVDTYFRYIADLRTGKDGAVEGLLSLWDDDGTMEFSGAPPVTGTYRGRNALHVLYKNRFSSSGMSLTTTGGQNTALGVVATDVHNVRSRGKRIVAGWTTTIGTQDGAGFGVSGSHTFELVNEKIKSLKVAVTPTPKRAEGLRMEELTVQDVGQLSLAAWCVV